MKMSNRFYTTTLIRGSMKNRYSFSQCFFLPSLEKQKDTLINDSLCMAFCWRLFHKHIAMKTIRMRTMTPSTQPTMRYNMSLLLVELAAGPTFPPFPEEFGGVLRSLMGYSEAPGTRFTSWNIKENMMSAWIQSLWNGLLSEGGLLRNPSQSVYTPCRDDLTTSESRRRLQLKSHAPKFWSTNLREIMSIKTHSLGRN